MTDETQADEDQPILDPTEELKAKHAAEIEKLKAQAKQYALDTAKGHAEVVATLQGKIDELSKGQTTRIRKGIVAALPDWTEQMARTIENLGSAWGPTLIAKKLRDPDFEHPFGFADFIPRVDKDGNVIRINGELVPE
jgi:hypothetical protein